MAETVKESANRAHNLGHLIATTQQAHKDVLALERQIAAITEAQIAPLKTKMSKIKKNACTDAACNLSDFTLAHKVFKRQEDARQFEDEAERDKVLDGMRFQFEALTKGSMLDFVDVLQGGDAAANDEDGFASPAKTLDEHSYDAWQALCDKHESGEAILFAEQAGGWATYSACAEAVFKALDMAESDMIAIDHSDLGRISAVKVPVVEIAEATDALTEAGFMVIQVTRDGIVGLHRATNDLGHDPGHEAAAE